MLLKGTKLMKKSQRRDVISLTARNMRITLVVSPAKNKKIFMIKNLLKYSNNSP